MKIAIIGSGISGNLVAHLLCREHQVSVFEAEAHVGGHAHTHDITIANRAFTVDTGFMVFNDRTYPNFVEMLRRLGVASRPSDMSFSVRCDRTGMEYQGSGLNGLFAQRTNLFRPSFYGLLREILRFNRESVAMLSTDDDGLTLGQYLSQNRYSGRFVEQYLVPMAAAIWSARADRMLEFPAHFIVRFFHNHGLLQVRDRPQWRTIVGGARSYVRALTKPFADSIRTGCPIQHVRRCEDEVDVVTRDGTSYRFDHVVLATHADQAVQLLAAPSDAERAVLGAFHFQRNEAVLHSDQRLLPRRRRAWASWNYHLVDDPRRPVAVTYELSRLQGLDAPTPICLTLNPNSPIDESTVLKRMTYDHPVFTQGALAAQRRHGEISGPRRTHFCGAYWGYGFHEDGVNSALAVAKYFGKGLEACKAASTQDAYDTSGPAPRITALSTVSS